jgi:hypothetical protein
MKPLGTIVVHTNHQPADHPTPSFECNERHVDCQNRPSIQGTEHGSKQTIGVRCIGRWQPSGEVGIMSVIGEIHANLDAIGPEQQACVFVFLMSYPLALGALLGAGGRRIAAGFAASSVLCFAFFTDPWFHAVMLVVLAVAATGVFIVALTLIDGAARALAFRGMPVHEVEFVDEDSIAETIEPPNEAGRKRLPIVAVVSLRH